MLFFPFETNRTVHLPKIYQFQPIITKTYICFLLPDTPSNDLLVESLENEIRSNANENDENFSTFDELPTRAQSILLQNSLGGRKFRVNSNPKHPFNNNHESSSKISLVRRARNHPWNMMYF